MCQLLYCTNQQQDLLQKGSFGDPKCTFCRYGIQYLHPFAREYDIWISLSSDTGNRTPVSRVTGGDTSHYTMSERFDDEKVGKIFTTPYHPHTHNTLITQYTHTYPESWLWHWLARVCMYLQIIKSCILLI